jgi:hypothetical protein
LAGAIEAGMKAEAEAASATRTEVRSMTKISGSFDGPTFLPEDGLSAKPSSRPKAG